MRTPPIHTRMALPQALIPRARNETGFANGQTFVPCTEVAVHIKMDNDGRQAIFGGRLGEEDDPS